MPKELTQENVGAWLSFLCGAVLAYRRDVNGPALAQHMKGRLAIAAPVFESMGKTTALKQCQGIIQMIGSKRARGRGGMPAIPYATAMLNLRALMKNKKWLSTFLISRHVTENQASLANAALSLWVPDTATVDKRELALDKRITILPDKFVRVLFVPEKVPQQKQYIDELRMLVKKFVGRNDVRLTPDEMRAAKAKYPELYKRYNFVKKMVSATYQQFIRSMVRKNDGKPVKIADALRELKQANIQAPALQGLDRLYIGEDGKLYTSAGKLIQAAPAPGSKITWNPKYDPRKDNGIIFWYMVPGSIAKRPKPAYTLAFVRANKTATDEKIEKHRRTIPKQRPLWLKDMKSPDRYKQTLAAILELLYSYAIRIGGVGNQTKGKATFGLSTLRVNQARPRSGGWLLTYPGKDGVAQKHIIKPVDDDAKRLLTIITRNVRGKNGKDFLWTKPDGTRITSGEINAYIKKVGLPITSHKFRHVRGTNLMEQELNNVKIPAKAGQREVEKIVKGLAVKVGALLGHVSGEKTTSATAIKSYITPGVIREFFQKRNLRVPQWVPQRGIKVEE